MKHRQYHSITAIEKASSLLKDAVLLAERKDGYFDVALYAVDGSYLEVFRHSHFKVIIKVIRFTDTVHLEPYLASISIDAILG
jgi:hypothetical protein